MGGGGRREIFDGLGLGLTFDDDGSGCRGSNDDGNGVGHE